MPEKYQAASGPVLHWVFKTKTGGTEGVLVAHQTAFKAREQAMMELGAEAAELTVIQGSPLSVPMKLQFPFPNGVELIFPTKKRVREKKVKKHERSKAIGKSNGKMHGNGARAASPFDGLRTRTRSG